MFAWPCVGQKVLSAGLAWRSSALFVGSFRAHQRGFDPALTTRRSITMAASETVERPRAHASADQTRSETKPSFKTTEFFAMVAIIAAILIASAVSDSLNDVRAWTLVAAVAIGYMISRGLAKSGTKHTASDS